MYQVSPYICFHAILGFDLYSPLVIVGPRVVLYYLYLR